MYLRNNDKSRKKNNLKYHTKITQKLCKLCKNQIKLTSNNTVKYF